MMKSISFGVQICFQENQFSKKKRKERKLIIEQFGKLQLIIEQIKNLRIGNNNYRIDLYVTS